MVDGFVHPDFRAVADVFDDQIRRTHGGASVCVYHRGEVVADLWGGVRDGDGSPWEADTLAMCFSTTKGVTSTAVHVCAERGLIDYDTPVCEYWPEFAQNGKEGVLVRHILSHSAGLHGLRRIISDASAMLDWDEMVAALAAAKPAYKPGTRSGYHALTYGWLAGELVRRVSGKDLDVFVADEICEPLGIDGLFLGCPPEQRHRIAPLRPVGLPPATSPVMGRMGKQIGKPFGQFLSLVHSPVNTRRMINAFAPRGVEDVLWGSEVLDAVIPAANGFLSARGLARMYAMIAGRGELDGVRLLSPERVRQMGTAQNRRIDLLLVAPMCWRLGYHIIVTSHGVNHEAMGHFGFGGSGGWADPKRDLAIAMVCNRGTGSPVGDLRLVRLGAAAMDGARARRAGAGPDGEGEGEGASRPGRTIAV